LKDINSSISGSYNKLRTPLYCDAWSQL